MMRARFVSCLVVSLFCLAFTTTILAQTSSAAAPGNRAVSFEETGAPASAEGGAFTSSVSGLQFRFHQSQAAVDATPAGISQANPIHLSLAGANRTPSLSP